jgi:hypothetical protein
VYFRRLFILWDIDILLTAIILVMFGRDLQLNISNLTSNYCLCGNDVMMGENKNNELIDVVYNISHHLGLAIFDNVSRRGS